MNEKEFIELLIKRDKETLNKFIDKYSMLITKTIAYVLKESHEREYIEECYDDVLMTVINKCGSFQYQCSLKVWIATIAKNKALDYKRKLKIYYKTDEIDENYVQEKSAEEEFLDSEKISAINNALNKLNSDEKKLFVNKFLMEKSTEELCQGLLISPSTLYKRISRLKSRVKELISDEKIQEGVYE